MSVATISGAVKQFLEAQSLGISVYRDAAPTGSKTPYCVVIEGISLGLAKLEDGAASTGVEQIQVDLWQTWQDASDQESESPTLADAITRALHGSQLLSGSNAPPRYVYSVLQRNRIRAVDRNARLVRHIYSLDVLRII